MDRIFFVKRRDIAVFLRIEIYFSEERESLPKIASERKKVQKMEKSDRPVYLSKLWKNRLNFEEEKKEFFSDEREIWREKLNRVKEENSEERRKVENVADHMCSCGHTFILWDTYASKLRYLWPSNKCRKTRERGSSPSPTFSLVILRGHSEPL